MSAFDGFRRKVVDVMIKILASRVTPIRSLDCTSLNYFETRKLFVTTRKGSVSRQQLLHEEMSFKCLLNVYVHVPDTSKHMAIYHGQVQKYC